MKIVKTLLNDCVIIEPKVFGDSRGFFLETFQAERYAEIANITQPFVQDNHSRSGKGVLRGLHFQIKNPQGKLVRVVRGEVFDVAVDLRPDSSTFGQWEGVLLSEENKRQFWVPPGFAHGFCTLEPNTMVAYKVDAYYSPADDRNLRWNDPAIGIEWPVAEADAIISGKDKAAPLLADLGRVF